ncbi:HupE/UreJ family protein, partial [Paracidovorax avenae]|uniref:HupE/UreJ family protein n=1 Tax=Paracidovorax avenae TaxID=80867 RepID=UPI001CEF6651
MRIARSLLPALLAAAALPALAHTGADAGHHHGFTAGFLHPLTGMDHLAAMVAVGLWSALAARSRRELLAAPLGFAEPCFADSDEDLCRQAYGGHVDFQQL